MINFLISYRAGTYHSFFVDQDEEFQLKKLKSTDKTEQGEIFEHQPFLKGRTALVRDGIRQATQ